MSGNRFTDASAQVGVERDAIPVWWGGYGKPLILTFPTMGVAYEFQHGLGVIPDGYLIVFADADIIAEPGVRWSQSIATLRAGADNAHAIVIFYTLSEAPTNA